MIEMSYIKPLNILARRLKVHVDEELFALSSF